MEPFIGQIIMFGGNFAPRGWALCDGQLLSISENQALFSILGTTYGGDGRTTFGLPDLRGRVAVHAGSGLGLTPRSLGAKFGAEENTLTTNQLPSHNHTATLTDGKVSLPVNTTAGEEDEKNPGAGVLANTNKDNFTTSGSNGIYGGGPQDSVSGTVTVNPTGSGQAVNNMQPSQCVNFIIALTGIFPSRN